MNRELRRDFTRVDAYELANSLAKFLQEISKYPLLSEKEEVILAAKIEKGDVEALNTLIVSNLRLVVRIAKDFDFYGLPLEHMISEGIRGLHRAAQKFDPKNGAKFSTYSAWWIKQSIRRYAAANSKPVRYPPNVFEAHSKLSRCDYKLLHRLGREPAEEELAVELGWTLKKVSTIRRSMGYAVNLDQFIHEAENGSLDKYNVIAAQSVPVDTQVIFQDNVEELLKVLSTELIPRELEIIERRFGLNGYPVQTLSEIGKRFRISRERIRQLERIALNKLREKMLGSLVEKHRAAISKLVKRGIPPRSIQQSLGLNGVSNFHQAIYQFKERPPRCCCGRAPYPHPGKCWQFSGELTKQELGGVCYTQGSLSTRSGGQDPNSLPVSKASRSR